MLTNSTEIIDGARRKGRIIAVVGSDKDRDAVTFAERLLELQYPRVVTLHGGLEVFRGAGVLVAPHA